MGRLVKGERNVVARMGEARRMVVGERKAYGRGNIEEGEERRRRRERGRGDIYEEKRKRGGGGEKDDLGKPDWQVLERAPVGFMAVSWIQLKTLVNSQVTRGKYRVSLERENFKSNRSPTFFLLNFSSNISP